MGQVKDKLKDVPDRFENMGRTGNNEHAKAVSELMDSIRNAVDNCQVSGNAQTGSAT